MIELVNIVSHTPTMKKPPQPDNFPPFQSVPFTGKSFGIPRIATVAQKVHSVYETDKIKPIMQQVEESVGKNYAQADEKTKAHMRVICDHMRTVAILIHNGVNSSDTTPAGRTLKDLLQRAQTAAKTVAPKKNNALPQVAEAAIKQLSLSPSHSEIEQSKTKILSTIHDETTSKE